jgi:hypothetical protein
MTSKIKNIIIFAAVAVALILVYVFFIKKAPGEQNLISSSGDITSTSTDIMDQNSLIAQNFLSVLLSVNNIKLNDTIFSDGSFINLHDSSILLTPPTDQGRLNPFAPIGYDAIPTPPAPSTATSSSIGLPQSITIPTCVLPQILDVSTNTCATPPVICTLPKVLDKSTNTCITPSTKKSKVN